MVTPRVDRELRGLARVLVRSGYADRQQITRSLTEAIRQDAPEAEPEQLAGRLVDTAVEDLREDAATWPTETDTDRLEAVLGELQERQFVVHRYCADHHDARRALAAAQSPRGLVFFTDTDVWHAVDFGMLELKVWHPDTANVAPGDELLDEVLTLLADNELEAVFDEGRIEVSVKWQRR